MSETEKIEFAETNNSPAILVLGELDNPVHGIPNDALIRVVKLNGLALKNIPSDMRTQELCDAAIEQNGLALGNVPENIKDAEKCRKAVDNDGRAIRYVPPSIMTQELAVLAVERNADAYLDVPKSLKTMLFNVLCCRANPSSIQHMDARFQAQAYAFAVVNHESAE